MFKQQTIRRQLPTILLGVYNALVYQVIKI